MKDRKMIPEGSKCFKCGKDNIKLIHHHISYNPENIVLCCLSCHKKIHMKIRKENKCPFSVEETRILSNISSDKRKYKKNQEKIIERTTKYNKSFTRRKTFVFDIEPYIYERTHIIYNISTNNISISSIFESKKEVKLYRIKEGNYK